MMTILVVRLLGLPTPSLIVSSQSVGLWMPVFWGSVYVPLFGPAPQYSSLYSVHISACPGVVSLQAFALLAAQKAMADCAHSHKPSELKL